MDDVVAPDAVPLRNVFVVEPVAPRDRIQRIATFDGVRRGSRARSRAARG